MEVENEDDKGCEDACVFGCCGTVYHGVRSHSGDPGTTGTSGTDDTNSRPSGLECWRCVDD